MKGITSVAVRGNVPVSCLPCVCAVSVSVLCLCWGCLVEGMRRGNGCSLVKGNSCTRTQRFVIDVCFPIFTDVKSAVVDAFFIK